MKICPHCGKDADAAPMLMLSTVEVLPRDLGFDEWWKKYPRKVCRKAAKKAYEKLVTTGLRIGDEIIKATPEQLMEGLRNYCLYKPEKQEWCHAASWLRGERWNDKEPEQERDQRREVRDLSPFIMREATEEKRPAPTGEVEAPASNRQEVTEKLRQALSALKR